MPPPGAAQQGEHHPTRPAAAPGSSIALGAEHGPQPVAPLARRAVGRNIMRADWPHPAGGRPDEPETARQGVRPQHPHGQRPHPALWVKQDLRQTGSWYSEV